MMCARTHFNVKCQFNSDDLFKGQSLIKNNTSRNNWKPLFEVNLRKNSTKTIRLFALDFYEAIVDSAFCLINYHHIEIESS